MSAPLTEAQIVRYSRQILLREVGGAGQRRLLSAVIEIDGASPALDVALAYLAASGSPVVCAEGPREGFVHGTALAEFAPDSTPGPSHERAGWLGTLERSPASLAQFRVALAPWGVVAAPAGLQLPVTAREVGPPAEPVTVGALAALLAQRFVLGLETQGLCVEWVKGRWLRR